MAIKVGIPRALLFYDYSYLWINFFEELGAQVIVSENTNKKILNDGIQNSVDEACLPVKLFHGHVIDLKDKVDYIFIPRIRSLFRGEHICPKFSGLPEMIKNSIKDLPGIIDSEIDLIKSKKNINKAIYDAGKYFSKDYKYMLYAYDKALLKFKEYNKNLEKEIEPLDESYLDEIYYKHNKLNNKKIILMGHPYNLYDSYMNMNIIKKLKLNGIDVLTPEMINIEYINAYARRYEGKIFWTFARKLIGTALYLINRKDIDGMIYVSSFGCGVDSVVADTIERRVRKKSNIPFMLLTLDEHTGEGGLNTRIDAFIDMIKWRDENESNIPTHG